MPRVIWKGHISFGLVTIPISLFPASGEDDLEFKMLDRRDMSPIGYRKVNKTSGEEVPAEEIVKGVEHDGEYVLLTEEDFKEANPVSTQSIDIVAFVDAAQIDPRYYARPYFVVPNRQSSKAYALLRETLSKSGKVGIAKVVLRTRQYVSALMVQGDMLVLELLRYSTELYDPAQYELPGKVGVTAKELEMAQMLVDGLNEEWKPEQYHDEYRQDLIRRIEEKASSGETTPIVARTDEEGEGGEVVDIMSLLKRSVEATKKPGRTAAPTKKKRSR